MAVINMKKICEKNGINTFSRTRGGWMKQVEGLDKQHSNGYSFVGSTFVKVGNFKSSILNGLYLDQSTSVVDNEKVLTMNLFDIHDGEVKLLKTVPKDDGWAIELWDEVEKYFKSTKETNPQDIVNTIRELTDNDPILIDEVIDILQFDAKKEVSSYPFKNWFEVRSYLAEMECHPVFPELVEDKEVDYIISSEYGLKYEDRTIITKMLNILEGITINENTNIDIKSVEPRSIKRNIFTLPFQAHKSFFIAHTTPNATGYHNGNIVIMFYYDKMSNVVVIRHFRYYFDTCKAFQEPSL